MVGLPVLFLSVAFLNVCLGSEHTTVTPVSASEKIPCPGHCVEEGACSVFLNDSDCDDGLVCCVEQDGSLTSSEYFTTAEPFGYSSQDEDGYEEVEAEVEEQDEDQTLNFPSSDDVNDFPDERSHYTYVYSEESDDFTLRRSGEVEDSCPGTCVPLQFSSECDYVLSEDPCPSGAACCLMHDDVQATSDQFNYFVMSDETSRAQNEENSFMKRAMPSPPEDSCPGTCVHPSHALFCEKILPQYSCPLNSKCCIKRSTESSSKVMQCTGQCLPLSMQGYCFTPNEMVLGPTTCESGKFCCMQGSSGSNVQPPSIGTMQYPDDQYEGLASDPAQVVMGHLAVDDEGSVFRVGTDGQISRLQTVARIDHLRAPNKFKRLMVYPRSGGHIVIYKDDTGALYQQFYPNNTYDPKTVFGRKPGARREKVDKPKPIWKPMIEEPIWEPMIEKPKEEEFSPQDLVTDPEFKQMHFIEERTDSEKEETLQELDDLSDLGPEPVIIPVNDDKPPVVQSKPSIPDVKTGRLTCPGSCMSYSLRFTCFNGSAIYDGFSCKGQRSVCCASLADIERHEKRLKNLSPYYKESSERSTPNCGIKGGKGSQHELSVKESLPGEWCWQVAVIDVMNQYICGGALISDSWVLTAAHCVSGSMKENQAIFVRAGVTDLKSPQDNNNGQTIRVVSTFIHRNFNSINLDNNIALLQLQKPVDLNNHVCVVCLPTGGQMPAENAKCTVTGYGFISKDGDMHLKMKEEQVPIVDDTECMANVTEALVNPFILPASSFCAGGQGQDCQGDAGGPLTCEVGGHHELVGLVSWTLGCGKKDVPSIYINVPVFMGWINEVITSRSFLTTLN